MAEIPYSKRGPLYSQVTKQARRNSNRSTYCCIKYVCHVNLTEADLEPWQQQQPKIANEPTRAKIACTPSTISYVKPIPRSKPYWTLPGDAGTSPSYCGMSTARTPSSPILACPVSRALSNRYIFSYAILTRQGFDPSRG